VTGSNTTASLLPPGAVASLCFHEVGTFEYDVATAGRTMHGKVLVEPREGVPAARPGRALPDVSQRKTESSQPAVAGVPGRSP
jgi:hypothetical protein